MSLIVARNSKIGLPKSVMFSFVTTDQYVRCKEGFKKLHYEFEGVEAFVSEDVVEFFSFIFAIVVEDIFDNFEYDILHFHFSILV